MKAVVFNAVGDIRLADVPEPAIEAPTDAVVRITTAAICGTDLHFVRGSVRNMQPGTVLGHEGVGVVEKVGPMVRSLRQGDRVVIPSTIACGTCESCRRGEFAQCGRANPHEGTAYFGGPRESGPFHGLQAERARVPYAHVGLVKLPDDVGDDQAILLSDIFPTGYFAADIAGIAPGDTVAVFGCGPVGQFAIASAKLLGAARVIAVDRHRDRLDMALRQGAEIVDFERDDPVATILELTGGHGVERAIDAVGVDAEAAAHGPAVPGGEAEARAFRQELGKVAGDAAARAGGDGPWRPGDAPSQVLRWAVAALARSGTLSIVGVYPAAADFFPIGAAMAKNLRVRMGNCNHRKYIPRLIELTRGGLVDPASVLTQSEPIASAIEAYEAFERRRPGWMKVALRPEGHRHGSEQRLDETLAETYPASDATAKM